MPRELPTHFSPRCCNTGPNLGYSCDPLLKEKVIAFSFFKICPPPWSKCQKKLKKTTVTTESDTLQRSFFHAPTNGLVITNGGLPESRSLKVCCIHLFICQSLIFQLKNVLRNSFHHCNCVIVIWLISGQAELSMASCIFIILWQHLSILLCRLRKGLSHTDGGQ